MWPIRLARGTCSTRPELKHSRSDLSCSSFTGKHVGDSSNPYSSSDTLLQSTHGYKSIRAKDPTDAGVSRASPAPFMNDSSRTCAKPSMHSATTTIPSSTSSP